jgi:RecA-family ATPase
MRNDLPALSRLEEEARRQSGERPAWRPPYPITADEWATACPAPACIVENILFADVKVTVAPGGMGKTTLKLFEAVHIALAMPLYGREIKRPGPVAILTAEDTREILVARLRQIAEAMRLPPEQQQMVRERVLISDTSGTGFRLAEIVCDVVMPSASVDLVIGGLAAVRPSLVVIDPAVSFGVGESRVNDAEQALIEAARKIRNGLNCAVELVHHSGKQNARDRAVDQYAGRGGSALADGARMVAVLAPVTADEWLAETGQELADDENAIRLALPKLSYSPKQPDILIRRRGYLFEAVEPAANGKQAALEANADMLHRLLASELAEGRQHSKNSLEHLAELRRADLRAALAWLEVCGRVEERASPTGGKGGRRRYLHPVASPRTNGEPIEENTP